MHCAHIVRASLGDFTMQIRSFRMEWPHWRHPYLDQLSGSLAFTLQMHTLGNSSYSVKLRNQLCLCDEQTNTNNITQNH